MAKKKIGYGKIIGSIALMSIVGFAVFHFYAISKGRKEREAMTVLQQGGV